VFYHLSGFFFVGSPDRIQTVYLADDLGENQISEVHSFAPSEVRTIDLGCKLWGMAQNKEVYEKDQFFVVLETTDSQLDFNKLHLTGSGIEDFDWKIVQAREVVPRVLFNDPVQKVQFKFWDGVNYSCALRRLGDIDIYWNLQRVDSSYDLNVVDIAVSIDSIFF